MVGPSGAPGLQPTRSFDWLSLMAMKTVSVFNTYYLCPNLVCQTARSEGRRGKTRRQGRNEEFAQKAKGPLHCLPSPPFRGTEGTSCCSPSLLALTPALRPAAEVWRPWWPGPVHPGTWGALLGVELCSLGGPCSPDVILASPGCPGGCCFGPFP